MRRIKVGSSSFFYSAGTAAVVLLGSTAALGFGGCTAGDTTGSKAGGGNGPTSANSGEGGSSSTGSTSASHSAGTTSGQTTVSGASSSGVTSTTANGTGGGAASVTTGSTSIASGPTGTGGTGSASASGATGSGGAGGSSGAADCSTLPLCDTFEATAAAAAPNSALWTIIPTSAAGSATIDTIGAHGSSHSLKVVSTDRVYVRNSTVIGTLGPVVHARFYLRFAMTLAQGHAAMVVTHPMAVDQYSQSNELRFGSQDSVFHWNTDSDAANIPDVSPQGDPNSVMPAANTWYCVELTINTNGHLNVSIDGKDVPGLTEDGTATPNIDAAWVGSTASLSRYTQLADFNVGWDSYGAGAMTLWYDDVALSASPIGCAN